MAKQGCREQAQKDEQGGQGQDGRSLGLHRGSRQEHKPHFRVILQDCRAQAAVLSQGSGVRGALTKTSLFLEPTPTFKVLVGTKPHGVDKELHEDISGHQHQEQNTQ